MKKLHSLLALFAVIALAGCASTPPAPGPIAQNNLAPTGTLRVAVFTGNPVLGTKKDGQLAGTTVAMGRALAQSAGVPVLLLVYLFNLCFPVLVIASFVNGYYWRYVAALWLAKTLVDWPVFLGAAKFFKRRSLVPLFFFFQPLHIMYTLISGFFGQLGEYEWKGRRVR